MKSLLVIALIAAAVFCAVNSAPSRRLKLTIIKHQPATRKPTKSERIRFPDMAQAPMQDDSERCEGCSYFQGPVKVSKAIKGTVQAFVVMKLGATSEPEQCQKADKNGCGGFGSCVYCDVRGNAKTVEAKSSGFITLKSTDGKSLDWESGLEPGTYDNIRVNFRMPTADEVKKMANVDQDTMDQAMEGGKKMFFLEVFLFDTEVNTLSHSELMKMATTDNEHVIGSHKIAGSISF